MTGTTRARQLVLHLMHVQPEDAQLPLTILVSINRGALRAPLEQLAKTHGGPAQNPWWCAKKAIRMVEQRWPTLTGGKLFGQDEHMHRLNNQLPADNVNQSYEELLRLARKPSPTVEQLLLVAWSDSVCYDPLVLLHALTHQNMSEKALECYLAFLDRELELSEEVEDMIRTFSKVAYE